MKEQTRIIRFEIEVREKDLPASFLQLHDGQDIDKDLLVDSIISLVDIMQHTTLRFETRKDLEEREQFNSSEWSATFEWSTKIKEINGLVFNHFSFRPLQEEIINAILSGKDTFACLPTGAGKSLLFQLPPLISERS